MCCPGVFHDYDDFHANDMIDCAPLEVISWVSLMTFMLIIQMQLHISAHADVNCPSLKINNIYDLIMTSS